VVRRRTLFSSYNCLTLHTNTREYCQGFYRFFAVLEKSGEFVTASAALMSTVCTDVLRVICAIVVAGLRPLGIYYTFCKQNRAKIACQTHGKPMLSQLPANTLDINLESVHL